MRDFVKREPVKRVREKSTELTDRERDILLLIRKGFSNKEIAFDLRVSYAQAAHSIYTTGKKLNMSRFEMISNHQPYYGSEEDTLA